MRKALANRAWIDHIAYFLHEFKKPLQLFSNFGVELFINGKDIQKIHGGQATLEINPGLWRDTESIELFYDQKIKKVFYVDGKNKNRLDEIHLKVSIAPPGIKKATFWKKLSGQNYDLIDTIKFSIF